jgi:hypothetical protein
MSLSQEQFEARVVQVIRESGFPESNVNAAALGAVYVGCTEAGKLQRVLSHLVMQGQELLALEPVLGLLGKEGEEFHTTLLSMYSFVSLVRFGTFLEYDAKNEGNVVDEELEGAMRLLIERGWSNIVAASLDNQAREKNA